MRAFLILSLLLGFFSTIGFAKDRYAFQSLEGQKQFERLTSNMRCMVCQNENLASSTSSFSDDMRNEIYRMIQIGRTDKQITQYMTARYGYFVSFTPPFNWETYLLWLAPLFLLILGVIVARSVYQKYRSP